jgi:hypothetical protein
MTHNRLNAVHLAALAGMMSGTPFVLPGESTETRRKPAKPKQPLPLPAGVQEYRYPCGFTCRARNQANADRKHTNHCNENH